MNMLARIVRSLALCWLAALTLATSPAFAHGEKAQQPVLRMRTLHWFDVDVSTRKLDVGQTLVVKGSFVPSRAWPEHVHSASETAFLNIGVPGPSFVRLDSRINGTPGIRSSSFEPGVQYDFEITLKARTPGRYHVHPVLNVKDAGPIIGPGIWVDVGGSAADFSNTVKTLTGQEIDLETYGFANAVGWSVLWAVIGLAWFGYWLTKVPLVLPRFRRVVELGNDRADEMITSRDRAAAVITLTVTLLLILGGYFWAQERWPITTPLQTGKIDTAQLPREPSPLTVRMDDARYRIPGRSFRIELTVTNHGDSPLSIGEFNSGNLRFINSKVLKAQPRDEDDLVAPDALRVEGDASIAPGQTRKIVIYADDALWETQRMTTMITSPDAVIAGMLFFYDAQGKRWPVEISGPMIPLFG
jgi:methane/ammonia monooxygenase subunit B